MTARVSVSAAGKFTADTKNTEELTRVLMKRLDGVAVRVTFAVALEDAEVRRRRDVPRKTKKSWGRGDDERGPGPRVLATVPLEAPDRSTICLQ